jgi:predicted glycosyltransferase
LDLLTPKQILFFRPIIGELQAGGHTVLATSRHYREVEQLASLLGMSLEFSGTRGDRDPRDQLKASLERMTNLLPVVADFRPDLAVSVASADCARLAFGLRVSHVAVNDSPHSLVAGKLSLPLSSHLLCPWVIPYSAWYRFGLRRPEITRYRALDPAAWLKRTPISTEGPGPGARHRPTILVRLEESYAPYMVGTDESWAGRVLERLASEFREYRLVALCRYPDQLEKVRQKFGHVFEVPERVVDGAAAIRSSDVFIGMGGTMTTEAALIGVPTISAFQGRGLYTERYLLSKRLLLKTQNLDTLTRYVKRSLREDYRAQCSRRAKRVLDSMEDPVERVVRFLTSTGAGAASPKSSKR